MKNRKTYWDKREQLFKALQHVDNAPASAIDDFFAQTNTTIDLVSQAYHGLKDVKNYGYEANTYHTQQMEYVFIKATNTLDAIMQRYDLDNPSMTWLSDEQQQSFKKDLLYAAQRFHDHVEEVRYNFYFKDDPEQTDASQPQAQQELSAIETARNNGPYAHLTYPYYQARDSLGNALQEKFGAGFNDSFEAFVAQTDAMLGVSAPPPRTTLPNLIGEGHASAMGNYNPGAHIQQQYIQQIESSLRMATSHLNQLRSAVDTLSEDAAIAALSKETTFLGDRLRVNAQAVKHQEIIRQQAQMQQQSL